MKKTRSRAAAKKIISRSRSHTRKENVELHTLVGLIGVFCYLLAYALVQMRRLSIDSNGYACLNIAGCVGGLYSLSHDFNLASVISQSMWLVFTLVGMHTSYRRRGELKNKIPPLDLDTINKPKD
jgi:hypothetical protein